MDDGEAGCLGPRRCRNRIFPSSYDAREDHDRLVEVPLMPAPRTVKLLIQWGRSKARRSALGNFRIPRFWTPIKFRRVEYHGGR
jgi:hypothetical protein